MTNHSVNRTPCQLRLQVLSKLHALVAGESLQNAFPSEPRPRGH